MADIEEDGQMDDIGSGAAGGSVSGKRFEVKKWNAVRWSAFATRYLRPALSFKAFQASFGD
jgi:hypothetical protein